MQEGQIFFLLLFRRVSDKLKSINYVSVNTHADVVVYGQVYKKGNNNYLRFIRMDMLLNMEDYTIQLANLFNGDKVLEQATNTALNENKSEFKKAIGPTLTTVVTKFILDFANNVTKSHSYDTLFPN